MSNIKITDNTALVTKHNVQAGQYYKDISPHGNGTVYIVAKNYGDVVGHPKSVYSLTSVVNGVPYLDEQVSSPQDVFGGDEDDFVYVPNVTITLS